MAGQEARSPSRRGGPPRYKSPTGLTFRETRVQKIRIAIEPIIGYIGCMKIGELAQRLGVPYRNVRYVLEQGHQPAGTETNPGRGALGSSTAKQTFWLALVLILKPNGLRLPLAAKIAEDLRLSMRVFTGNLVGMAALIPFLGRFETQHEWYLDIAEFR